MYICTVEEELNKWMTETRHAIIGIIQSALLTVYCLSLAERNEILIIGNDDRIK